MTPVAPRIVNDVSYVTRINHHSHFAWQVQYLVTLEMTPVTPRIVNDVSYATDSNHVNNGSYVSGSIMNAAL